MRRLVALLLVLTPSVVASQPADPYLIVLGIAQDGGVPQAGSRNHPGWADTTMRRLVVSLALIDPATNQRWMFEATPDFREQLHRLDTVAPVASQPGLDGIFITHAHVGHYTGLMFLGHESMGARAVPVYVMPRVAAFLEGNGPWDQLVRYENIKLRRLADGKPVHLNDRLAVTPTIVPHRQEYGEVVGFRIDGPNRSVLFIPDIDSWEEWDEMGVRIEDRVRDVDVAYLDATFFADGEIPGRDMSGFPHPFITHSMERLDALDSPNKQKVRFIHLNHTNPVLWPVSDERVWVEARGFSVAEEWERVDL